MFHCSDCKRPVRIAEGRLVDNDGESDCSARQHRFDSGHTLDYADVQALLDALDLRDFVRSIVTDAMEDHELHKH